MRIERRLSHCTAPTVTVGQATDSERSSIGFSRGTTSGLPARRARRACAQYEHSDGSNRQQNAADARLLQTIDESRSLAFHLNFSVMFGGHFRPEIAAHCTFLKPRSYSRTAQASKQASEQHARKTIGQRLPYSVSLANKARVSSEGETWNFSANTVCNS